MQPAVMEADGSGAPAGQLPALREDLGLFQGPRTVLGEPTWTLHDPVRNRYFQLGLTEFELVAQWRPGITAAELAETVSRNGLAVSEGQVEQFAGFLRTAELIEGGAGSGKRFAQSAERRTRSLWERVLHNYLFFRIPLVRPDRILDVVYPVVRPLLARRFLYLTLLAGAIGMFMVLRQWDIFLSTFMGYLNWTGALAFGATLVIVKVLHEAGHAIACRHHGLRVPTIGVVFIVMWPVMYTDATEAWRLTSRRARVAIASAGMLVELTIACFATLAWVLVPDGIVRSALFMLATTTWVLSLAVNLNPMMKFDGYYIFSDLVNIPNLQDRGFALARNRLRHFLFGAPIAGDSGLDRRHEVIAIVWAYATWIYRFFLFLGIALLVYHFFFKALGIFLFVVEIWWFIGAPIWREVREWRSLAGAIDPVRRRMAIAGAAVLLLLVVIPWNSSFLAPAVMRVEDLQRIFPPEPARITAVHVAPATAVAAGVPLFSLVSPELEAQVMEGSAKVQAAELELQRVMASKDTSHERLVAEESVARARAELDGLLVRREKLVVVAPFAGRVADMPPHVREGLWVGEKQRLASLLGAGNTYVVDAWVTEDHYRFVRVGAEGRFYPDEPGLRPWQAVVTQVDPADTRVLTEPYVAEVYGGGVPGRSDPEQGFVPEQAIYRVRAVVTIGQGDEPPGRALRGHLRLEGDDRSFAARFTTFLVGTLIRESGF